MSTNEGMTDSGIHKFVGPDIILAAQATANFSRVNEFDPCNSTVPVGFKQLAELTARMELKSMPTTAIQLYDIWGEREDDRLLDALPFGLVAAEIIAKSAQDNKRRLHILGGVPTGLVQAEVRTTQFFAQRAILSRLNVLAATRPGSADSLQSGSLRADASREWGHTTVSNVLKGTIGAGLVVWGARQASRALDRS